MAPAGTTPTWPVDESVTTNAVGVAVTPPADADETAVAVALSLAWRLDGVKKLGCTEEFLTCDGSRHSVNPTTNASNATRYYFAGTGAAAGGEFISCDSGVSATFPMVSRRLVSAVDAKQLERRRPRRGGFIRRPLRVGHREANLRGRGVRPRQADELFV